MLRPFGKFLLPLLVVLGLLVQPACRSSRGKATGPDTGEIHRNVAAIREAILARDAAGVLARATPGFSFTGSDGQALDRAAFLARTDTDFARVTRIESLLSTVDRLIPRGSEPNVADAEITHDMIRRERTDDGGEQRVLVRYRERQEWIHGDDGWWLRRATALGPVVRTPLQAR